jgi:16S rRNA (cytosine967-C5)-methyltransferase
MKYAPQHLRSAASLIGQYNGSVPFAVFLKQFFSENKKYGSKDRKRIAHLCYCYYRLGHALAKWTVEERLRVALFLCNDTAEDWSVLFEEDWISNWKPSLQMRLRFVEEKIPAFSVLDIFPWHTQLSSDAYDPYAFCLSHLVQPDLFLRIRPGNKEKVFQKLRQAAMPFTAVTNECIALPNGSKIDTVVDVDSEVVVQDYSSQQVGELLKKIRQDKKKSFETWDCCAASGGKSILVTDTLSTVSLTVSDLRKSIIQNLETRFKKAGIKPKTVFVGDLSQPLRSASLPAFDLVVCDVPCTGSGTWGRTPEQLYHFSEEKIEEYASLQKKIVSNVIPHIKPGGYLLYITCSVFAKENEAREAEILAQGMELVRMDWLQGYDQKADSMFAALYKLRG